MIKRLISFSTLVFLFMSSAALAAPERSHVANYLRGALSSSLNLDSFQFRVFEGESGTGRVSISGNASLQAELYDRIQGDNGRTWFLEKALSDGVGAEVEGVQGLSDTLRLTPTNIQDAHQDFLRDHRGPLIGSNLGNYVILVPTAEAGTRVSFQYEVNYRATVNGFDFRTLDQTVNMPRGYTLQASRQRYGGTAVVRGSNDAQTIVNFIIGIAMEKAREDVGTRGELDRTKTDFRKLVSGDLLWGTRMLITGCEITNESDDLVWETDRPRGTLTVYVVQADCTGISSNDSRNGRFRFMDGLEVYPDQTRPMSIRLIFPKRHSVGNLDSFPQHWFNICLKMIDEDVGRGGVFASQHKLGEFSCVGGARHFGGPYVWLDDRTGFAAPRRDPPIISAAAAPSNVDLSNFGRGRGEENEGTAVDITGASGRVANWDRATSITLSGHTDTVLSAAFSPDGLRVVTASRDSTARIWDVASGRQIDTLRANASGVTRAEFSPDGQRIVTALGDGTARIWDVTSGQEVVRLNGHGDVAHSAAFSPDGERIVTASGDGTARIWDSASGRQIVSFDGHTDRVFSAAFSPDGERIVTASFDSSARIWDAASGRQIVSFNGHTSWVFFAAFSPDGERIVTASGDGSARIWDPASGTQIATLSAREGGVYTASFSPNGQQIVTSSELTAAVWDPVDERRIAVLQERRGLSPQSVFFATFSPDGQRIVTAREDNTARIWSPP